MHSLALILAVVTQTLAPATQPPPDPVGSGALAAAPRDERPSEKTPTTRPAPVEIYGESDRRPTFGGWTMQVERSWWGVDGRSMQGRLSMPGTELANPLADELWRFTMRGGGWGVQVGARRDGPLGTRLSTSVGARRDPSPTHFLTNATGGPGPWLGPMQPAGNFSAQPTFWDMRVRIERPFKTGPLDLTVFAEGFGSVATGDRRSALPAGAARTLSGRAVRGGVNVGF